MSSFYAKQRFPGIKESDKGMCPTSSGGLSNKLWREGGRFVGKKKTAEKIRSLSETDVSSWQEQGTLEARRSSTDKDIVSQNKGDQMSLQFAGGVVWPSPSLLFVPLVTPYLSNWDACDVAVLISLLSSFVHRLCFFFRRARSLVNEEAERQPYQSGRQEHQGRI